MIASDYGIENFYAVSQNYSAVAEQSKRRNILYDNYLEILEKIFTVYRQFYEETQQIFKTRMHEKSIYVEELKSFLRKFSQIMRDTSINQIDSITEMRVNRQDIINRVTGELLGKVDGYSRIQKKFKSRLEELTQKRQQAIKLYSNLKSQSSQASAFYNRHTKAKVKLVSEKLDDITQLQKELQTSKKQIFNNAEQYQSYLINFRKKLIHNKYNMLNRMIDQSKHFKSCLTETLLLLIECVNSKSEVFMGLVKNPKDDTITISQSKGRKKGEDLDTLVSSLINSIQQYNHIIDQILFIIKGLDSAFKRVNVKVQQILQNYKKYFIDNLNGIYPIDETPLREVNDTLDLYQFYTAKISAISDKIYQCSNKLNMLKQNVKKHADVTLSLIRSNPKSRQQTKLPQLDQVYNQISYDFVTEIIYEIYRAFKQILGDLKTHFNQKYYKKKKNKVEDSMQISHVDETIIAQKKKPCKMELWLWRDWRDKATYSLQPFQYDPKEISKFLSTIKFEQESKEIAKYQCLFYGKKDVKGILKICQKSIQFVSLIGAGNIHLSVPYNQISAVEIKVRIIQKYIAIQTQKGELGFSKFLDILSVHSLIKETIEKTANGAPKVAKRAAVPLLPEQLDYLQKNRGKINEQRPSSEGLTKIKSIFVDNITIDTVYQYIYSDKQFTLRGKPEESFFTYSQKKAKNFNYVTGKYDKPGPEFYSRVPQVKFTNCPVFSTKVNEFDHPIPPIPFMPSSCHCKQTCNIYWLSNQSFDYFVLSQSSKAPYSDTFQVKILHKVFKEGNGVKIQLLGGLFFIKQFAMKGMIKSKGESEMLQQGQITLSQIQKTLNMVTGNSSVQKQAKQETPGDSKTADGQPNNQVSKLKNQNKLLIIALLAVFLINILLRFVIS